MIELRRDRKKTTSTDYYTYKIYRNGSMVTLPNRENPAKITITFINGTFKSVNCHEDEQDLTSILKNPRDRWCASKAVEEKICELEEKTTKGLKMEPQKKQTCTLKPAVAEINYCPYCDKKLPQGLSDDDRQAEMREIQKIRELLKDMEAGKKKIDYFIEKNLNKVGSPTGTITAKIKPEKIINIRPSSSETIETDEGKVYRRFSENYWEIWEKMTWEPLFDYNEIEKAYQKYKDWTRKKELVSLGMKIHKGTLTHPEIEELKKMGIITENFC